MKPIKFRELVIICSFLSVFGISFAQEAFSLSINISQAPSVWNPITAEGVAGGMQDLEMEYGEDWLGNDCAGYIASRPDHILTMRQAVGELHFRVQSDTDTVLFIESIRTGAYYCADDGPLASMGSDAYITLNLNSGAYRVHIGSYNLLNDYPPYTLWIYQ